jgi:cbb3-type cytochrome c oxidase subunit III
VDAAAIYKQQCAKCHAADGKGIPSLEPPDMTSAEWQTKTTDKEIETAIKEGKGIMPGFSDTLSAAQIAALVKYVRTLKKAE